MIDDSEKNPPTRNTARIMHPSYDQIIDKPKETGKAIRIAVATGALVLGTTLLLPPTIDGLETVLGF